MDHRNAAASSLNPPVSDSAPGKADKCLPARGEYNVQCLNKCEALLIGQRKIDSILKSDKSATTSRAGVADFKNKGSRAISTLL
ncbi:MAG: hypothetical protein GY868_09950 [Deltaproteobacteria bacterium]|nr:hypothetical protein [Deltaproteobacteria bacterium]